MERLGRVECPWSVLAVRSRNELEVKPDTGRTYVGT